MSRTRTALVVVAALAAAGFAAPVAQAGQHKAFSVVVTPTTVPSAADVPMEATVKNHAKTQRIGSFDLHPPRYTLPGTDVVVEFVVTSASAPGAAVNIVDGVVQVRNAAIPAGGSLSVSMGVDTTRLTGDWTWTALAKQANDFRGDGNDFVLVGAESARTTSVEGEGDGNSVVQTKHCESGKKCTVSVTYHDADTGDIISMHAEALLPSGEAGGAGFTSSSLAQAETDEPPLHAELPVIDARAELDEQRCSNLLMLSRVTGLVTGPGDRDKQVTFTVDEVADLTTDPAGICYAGPTPSALNPSYPVPGTPFQARESLFFPSVLADCATLSEGTKSVSACAESSELVDGNHVHVVHVPTLIEDPVYRG